MDGCTYAVRAVCSDLSNNDITIIESGAFADLPLLTTIKVSGNYITIIESGAFSNLPLLTTIDLSNNGITIIESGAFSNLPLLSTIDLSQNVNATAVVGAFDGLLNVATFIADVTLGRTDGAVEVCARVDAQRSSAVIDALCNQGCNTFGTETVGVEEGCSVGSPVQCCNGKCIQKFYLNGFGDNCGDGSDETEVPFSQCAAERAASPIGTRTVVSVECTGACRSFSDDGDSCHENALTKVPHFVNKGVTDM